MTVHGPTPPPAIHRLLTPGDFATPPAVVPGESAWQAAALSGIKDRDNLAAAAGIDPKVLAAAEKEEWRIPIKAASER